MRNAMHTLHSFTVRALAVSLSTFAVLQSVASAQTIEYYHLDALGSVRAVTDQSGTVIERHDLLPFGEEVAPPGGANPRLFTGKERDAETGMDYFGARYYSGKRARFTTVDPFYSWEENLVDPQRWNRYSYVRNNPLRYTDPDGRNPLAIGAIVWLLYEVGSSISDAIATYTTVTNPNASAAEKATTTGLFVAGVLPGVPGGAATAGRAAKQASKTAAEMADDLAGRIGRNSVSVETPGVKIRVDLRGRSHFDKATQQEVPTPHVQTAQKHVGPTGQVNVGAKSVRPATKADVRTAQKVVERTESK